MNVLKLLRCSWRHLYSTGKYTSVTYYVMYERVHHITHPVFQQFGNFRMVTKHEDEVDKLIYQQLVEELAKIPNIEDLSVSTNEFDLWGGIEEKQYALCSNSAYGYNFRPLMLITELGLISALATRIVFVGISEETLQQHIFPVIPSLLSMPAGIDYSTIRHQEFMQQQHVEEILRRNDGIDLSRFGI